jgi:GAF domain
MTTSVNATATEEHEPASQCSTRTVETMTHTGDVGTEFAPEVADDPGLAARLDDLLHRTCSLARALTGAEQAALKVDLDGDGHAARKFFNLSERYARRRDYRVDPRGLRLHGIRLAPGQVVRLTQDEVEAHPDWAGFGDQAARHPPLRAWLATAVCGGDGRNYGLLQLSDKSGRSRLHRRRRRPHPRARCLRGRHPRCAPSGAALT